MQIQLSDVAIKLQARLIGEDAVFSQVSTDTRTIQKGDLFVALKGERYDAHDCLDQAEQSGAIAAMVSRSSETSIPQLMVEDTRLALGRLASVWRQQFSIPVAAITGSNGKTTVKEMIAAIMQQRGDVLATFGNLNNDIGVPLTLLRMQDHHRSAVIEMGANHAGEIAYLCSMAQPDVAVITNAAAAHLEGFGSIDGVAHAKGEMFSNLPASGVVIINADDKYASLWQRMAGDRKTLRFGLDAQADITAQWSVDLQSSQIQLHTPVGEIALKLKLPGRHNVMNALAATAVSLEMGASLSDIQKGLESIQPVSGRMQTLNGLPGMQILNDTYNANPASYTAAIEVLAGLDGHKWLVMGDMAELGDNAASLHAYCGKKAKELGIDRLYAIGALSQHAVSSFGNEAYWYQDKDELVSDLLDNWSGEGTVLVKGSRSMKMEQVVARLQAGGE